MNDGAGHNTLADTLNIQVTSVAGRQLVAGLYWEKLDRVRSYMQEAREKGREFGMDIVAIRQGQDGTQAGFAPKGRGAIKHMYSMAAVVAGVVGSNALVAFKLEDGRYGLVGTLDGLIVAGCDAVGDRDEIENQFREMYARATSADRTWARVAAPEEFEFGQDRFDLHEELDAGAFRKEHRLQALTFGLTRGEIIRYAALATVTIVLVGAGIVLKHQYDQKQARAAAFAALAKADADAKAAARAPAQPTAQLPHPWVKQPPIGEFIAACEQHTGPLPLSIAGWVLATTKCTNGNFGATYAQANGIPYSAFAAATQNRFGVQPGPLDDTYTTAGVAAGYEPIKGSGDDMLEPRDIARGRFLSHWQALDQSVALTLVPQPEPKPDKPAAPTPDWQTYTFHFDTHIPPATAFGGLDLAGVRVTQIDEKLDAATAELTWTITGALYAH